MISVIVNVESPRWRSLVRPLIAPVRATCEAALKDSTIRKAELTVVLADDAFIRALNRDYRGKDKPTNVLSFSGERDYLGDIVLALETVQREAKQQGKTVRGHMMHLLVHGTLHLLGHDHMDKKEAETMEAREIKILKELGISNPYL